MSLLMCAVSIDRRKQGEDAPTDHSHASAGGDAPTDHTHASTGGDAPTDHTDASADGDAPTDHTYTSVAGLNHPSVLEVRVLFEELVLVSSVH